MNSDVTTTLNQLTPKQLAVLQQKLQEAKSMSGSAQSGHGIHPRPPGTGLPLSVAQEQLFSLTQFDPENTRYILNDVKQLQGKIDLIALEKSIAALLRRHESLRSVFIEMNGKPHQVTSPYTAAPLFVTQSIVELIECGHSFLADLVEAEARALVQLDKGPLIRFRLLRLADENHILILSIHHISADRWSLDIIYRELSECYQSIILGQEPKLPLLPIQFADFAHWQHDWLEQSRAQKQLVFWKQTLADVPPLQLPTSTNGVASSTEDNRALRRDLPREVVEALRAHGNSTDSTLFVPLFTAFKVALFRYSHQTEMVICTPVAGRKHAETEELVGYFSNLIAIRTELSGNLPLHELQRRLHEALMAAYANDEYPFQSIAGLPQLSTVPLNRACFAMQDGYRDEVLFPGVSTDSLDIGCGDTDFEIALYIESGDDGLTALLECNSRRLTDSHAAELLDVYLDTLHYYANNPYITLQELPPIAMSDRITLSPQEAGGGENNANDSCVTARSAMLPRVDGQYLELTNGGLPTIKGELATLEQQLAIVWEDVLGLQGLSRTENFFDLGGHSLTALNLCSRIEKIVTGKKMPLAMLVEAPTIAQMAIYIHSEQAERGWSLAVPLQKSGSKPPLFCIHAAGGNVLLYSDLATYLSDYDQPVYGVQSQGLDGKEPILKTVEEMAQVYANEILAVNPNGPYLLAGYCLGGTIALEVAQCLQAKGHTVAFLGLLETYNWANAQDDTLFGSAKHQAQRAEFMVRNFMMLGGTQRRNFIQRKKERIAGRTKIWSGSMRTLVNKETKSAPRSSARSEDQRLAEIWESNDEAADRYIPKPYSGKITHYVPMKDFAEYSIPEVGWDAIARNGVERHTLPVYPAGMVYEPFVRTLAEIMTTDIDSGLNANNF